MRSPFVYSRLRDQSGVLRPRRSIQNHQAVYGGLFLIASLLSLRLHPAIAAEQLYVSFSIIEQSIPVRSLERYAKTGVIDDPLAAYTQYLKPEQLIRLRQVLAAEIEVSPVAVSQFLYSPQGEVLLERLGRVIQTPARQPGVFALRSALILAASEPEGLTLLNVLRLFPTSGIRVDLEEALTIAQELETLVQRTQEATQTVIAQAQTEAANNPLPPSVVSTLQRTGFLSPNIGDLGPLSWTMQTLTLYDITRNRTFPADIYLPQGVSQAVPVIVISHGLGSNRMSYQYLAQYLASRGFAVAVPEHIGSSAQQQIALISGRANEVAEPSEFVNRPLDIRFLLDELERRSQSDPIFQNRLNLDQVGVIGQSFGGYTALVLAGSPINFELLQSECQFSQSNWNVSLLLQCRALELLGSQANLQDKRIKAAIAINPLSSRVLGEAGLSQIQVPVMIISGSDDPIAPALAEQIEPFTWLKNVPEKYFVLMQGGTHFTTLQPTSEDIPLPPVVLGADPALGRYYTKILSLAFFDAFVVGRSQYRSILNAAAIQSLSEPEMPIFLLKDLQLNQIPSIPQGAF